MNTTALNGISSDTILTVRPSDTPSVDAFRRQRISQPFGLFDNKFLSSKNHLLWDERLTGCIMIHGTVTGTFEVGQTFTGSTSEYHGVIASVDNPTSFTYSTIDNSFTVGETITTATGSAVITSINTGTHVEYQYYRASVALKVGTLQGQKAIRQTFRYFPYISGYSQLVNTTQVFNEPKIGLKQTVMYGDNLNGIGIVQDELITKLLIRSNTSGVPVDSLLAQSDWNLDNLSGNGVEHGNPSGVKLDITKNQIQTLDFQWLGVGRIRCGFNIDGKLIYVHEFNHATLASGVYMRTPTLPIRYEIENVSATASPSSLEQICAAVASEGGYAIPGFEFSVSHGITERSLADGVRTPILAIRLKNASENGGIPVRNTLKLIDSGLFARAADVYFELVHIHEMRSFTGIWISIDDSSAAMISKDITALTAHHIHEIEGAMVATGTGMNAGATDVINTSIISNHIYLSQDIDSELSEMFVIYATSRFGAGYASAHISWIELE